MKGTILITILFYIGAWTLVLFFQEICDRYPGGSVWLTGSLTTGAFLGCVISDICRWLQRK